MTPRWLDDLARVLGTTGVPRRRLLRVVVGGTLGVGLARHRGDAGAQAACTQDTDCLPPGASPCTGARCEAGACVVVSVACVPGFTCCGGACVPACSPTQVLDADCQCVDTGPNAGEDNETPAADETPAVPTQVTPAAGADATAAVVSGRLAHIHAGSCGADEGRAVVQPLTDVTAPAGRHEGPSQAVVAETSFTPAMPRSLDELLATDHVIHIHRAAAASGTVILCGAIGGARDASGALAIGLQEHNGSGFTGVAYLAPSLTGGADATDVTVFVVQDLATH